MFDIAHLFESPSSSPAFIVAEIGINHNGSLDLAKRQIDGAKEAGADAVKFQVFRTEHFYNRRLAPGAFDLFKSLELSFDDFSILNEFAKERGLIFFATPLDFVSLDFLVRLDVPVIKTASSDITCEPFLKKVADTGKYAILSTGFTELEEIKRGVRFFDNKKLALLYCVSKYPCCANDFDLNFLKVLADNFDTTVGFSDHSLENIFSIAAVVLGAKIIERHFTVDNSLEGADHKISLNQSAFASLVSSIRDIESSLVSETKRACEFEQEIRPLSMRSVYAKRDILQGETINESDIALLRPGSGVSLTRFESIVGKIAKKDIAKDEAF
jgi:sialic acid synthase SpsE